MNIKEAKEQIKNAMKAYFTKDNFGNYRLPTNAQRPVFLMGPPGVGKTAIMEQIASELGVALVSYSMTHHTRQSALGLPFIEKKLYNGKEYQVSEYTMSEIIASVYDTMEASGCKEGILFLDEINCVSETLAPSMLQFLQYKVFGRHKVPDGWIVVTAGNPPEYNNSVREFDIVTWDRLKRIDIEEDYDVWKEYAYKKGIHPAIITYLDVKKADFYKIESTVEGKSFVTARGWCDLSDMIKLFEENNLKVDENLISQYLQNKSIAKSFAIYYDLFKKYQSDYQIENIIKGKATQEIKDRAKNAKFDERLAVLGLLISAMTEEHKTIYHAEMTIKEMRTIIGSLAGLAKTSKTGLVDEIDDQIKQVEERIRRAKASSRLSPDDEYVLRNTVRELDNIKTVLIASATSDNNSSFNKIKAEYDKLLKDLKKQAEEVKKCMSNAFKFCNEVFSEGQEILILVTELTINFYGSNFINRFGCDEYFAHNKELLFYERQKETLAELEVWNYNPEMEGWEKE